MKEQRCNGTEIKSQDTIITTEKEREKSTSSYVFDRVKQRSTSEEKKKQYGRMKKKETTEKAVKIGKKKRRRKKAAKNGTFFKLWIRCRRKSE